MIKKNIFLITAITRRPTVFWSDDVTILSTQSVVLRNPVFLPDDVRISSTHSVILRSVLCDVRISSFKVFMKNKKPKKMRSSRLHKAKPQDDGLKTPSPPKDGTPPRRGIV
jgi:hypothetical protein